jgi:hypothetical protein
VTRDWMAVATAIDGRLIELGLELRELAARSKVSESILRELRYNTKERKRSARTLSAVSLGLEWPADYLDSVLGGVPTSSAEPHPSTDERVDSLSRQLDEMKSLLVEMDKKLSTLVSGRGDRDADR